MGASAMETKGQTGRGTPGPATASVPGRLNEFQRTMLQWSGLHPYNAVHAARISPPPDPVRFVAAASHVLREAGLAGYAVDARRGVYRYGAAAEEIAALVLDGGEDPLRTVHGEMERWLNEPFPFDGGFQPFRFFLVRGAAESFAGVAYFHVAADAESVGRLLAEVLAAAFDETPRALRDNALAERRASGAPTGSVWKWGRRLAGACRKFQEMRRSHRSPDCPVNEFRNRWFASAFDAEETARVLAYAKDRRATVNDLCLAALLKAVVPATSARFEKRRQHLSVGCVVNLRRDLPERRRRDFGLFLGSFSVTHPAPPDISLDELIASVRRQTEEVKRDKLYLASRLEFRLNRFLFARQPIEKQRNFYRKAYPVWGSITNFKMDGIDGGPHWRATDYYRAVSTGPALPFVVGVTGYGGRLNFGFSYRPDVISEETVRGIAERFLSLLSGKEGEQ